MAQTLLVPVTLTPSAEDAEILEKNGALLTELGFEIEPFGDTAYAVRAVPADMGMTDDYTAAIEEGATMYLEGLDQYRGWFQSSLLTAVGAFGKGAPFRECVTHGWTVDGEGKAMGTPQTTLLIAVFIALIRSASDINFTPVKIWKNFSIRPHKKHTIF